MRNHNRIFTVSILLLACCLVSVGVAQIVHPAKRVRPEKNAPLADAVCKYDTKKALVLLSQGADPNQMDTDGETMLSLAASRDDIPLISALLSHNADINLAGCRDGLVVAGGPGPRWGTPLAEAIKSYDLPTVCFLINHGADLNEPEYQSAGNIPLLVDFDIGRLYPDGHDKADGDNIFKLLLSHGAEVDHRDSNGDTPLMSEVSWDDPVRIQILIDHGADINATDSYGITPLMAAVLRLKPYEACGPSTSFGIWSKRDIAVVKLLLAHHPKINARDHSGKSALDWAKGDDAIVALLKKAGAKS